MRSKKVKINNPSGRTMEQKGFDDMATIALGDDGKVNRSKMKFDSSNDYNISQFFHDMVKKENKGLSILIIIAIVCLALIICIGMFTEHHDEHIDGKMKVSYYSGDLKETVPTEEDILLKLTGDTKLILSAPKPQEIEIKISGFCKCN